MIFFTKTSLKKSRAEDTYVLNVAILIAMSAILPGEINHSELEQKIASLILWIILVCSVPYINPLIKQQRLCNLAQY